MASCHGWILQLQQPAVPALARLLNNSSQWRLYRGNIWKYFLSSWFCVFAVSATNVSVHRSPPFLVKTSTLSMSAKQQSVGIP